MNKFFIFFILKFVVFSSLYSQIIWDKDYVEDSPIERDLRPHNYQLYPSVLRAGNSIILNDGFFVPMGATLKADVGSDLYAFTHSNNCIATGNRSFFSSIKNDGYNENEIRDEEELLNNLESDIQKLAPKIYPQPSEGKVMIEVSNCEKVKQIQIRNQFGAVVDYTGDVKKNNSFDLSNRNNGLYLVYIIWNEDLLVEKLILK